MSAIISPFTPRYVTNAAVVCRIVAAKIIPIVPVMIMPTIARFVVSRVWISLVIVKRIPAIVIAKRKIHIHKSYERRSPPTAFPVELAARAPGPVVVVVNPAAIVIRRPTPGFIAHPGPAIR